MWAGVVWATYTSPWAIRIRPSSLRRSGRPWSALPNADSLVTWPPKLAVEAWPPVFE